MRRVTSNLLQIEKVLLRHSFAGNEGVDGWLIFSFQP